MKIGNSKMNMEMDFKNGMSMHMDGMPDMKMECFDINTDVPKKDGKSKISKETETLYESELEEILENKGNVISRQSMQQNGSVIRTIVYEYGDKLYKRNIVIQNGKKIINEIKEIDNL